MYDVSERTLKQKQGCHVWYDNDPSRLENYNQLRRGVDKCIDFQQQIIKKLSRTRGYKCV